MATPRGVAASGHRRHARYVWRDNDSTYGSTFARVAARSGVEVRTTPCRTPRANAPCERFLGSVRRACLDHVLIRGEAHLRRVLREYVAYVNGARPRQGSAHRVPQPGAVPPLPMRGAAETTRVLVLGGLHHDDRRVA